MRLAFIGAIAAGACVASQAAAGTLTESFDFSGNNITGQSTFIYGGLFDPRLGTLTGVSITAQGTYTPSIFVGIPGVSTASVLNYSLSGDRPLAYETGALGTYHLVAQPNGYLTGPARSFSISDDVGSIADYLGTRSDLLATIDLFSTPLHHDWGAYDELSAYSGKLQVTYTYTAVPEPAAWAMLASGLALMGVARRRRKAQEDCGAARMG